jgi:hypothetical protein
VPITLAQAQVNAANAIDYRVIDNLRRYDNVLLDRIVFDDTVTPGTGGGSLTYGYTRLTQAASAAPRNINEEYVPGKATRAQQYVNLKPFGASFELDRVLRNLGPSNTNEVTFQMIQATVALRVRFTQEIILGDTAVDGRGFDGLSKLLTGSSTEVTGSTLDISAATITSQAAAIAAFDSIDMWLSSLVPSRVGSGGDPQDPNALPPGSHAILGNTQLVTRLSSLARWAGIYSESKDDLGRRIRRYGDWDLIDLGNRQDGSSPIIPTGASVAGETDMYAVSFGLDGLHGASVAGSPLVNTFMPDYTTSGAVKLGEIEMGPAAVVLKSTTSAGVRRRVKVI